MFRTSAVTRLAGVGVLVAALGCTLLISGCGNSEMDSSGGMPPAGSSTTTTKVAASGPALNTPLAFDQLALESPAVKVTNKDKQSFYKFKYADRDGNVYECMLPEAMAQGSYTVSEWGHTFDVYKLPKVVAHKKVKARKPGEIGDFPFISPKPRVVEQPKTEQPDMPPAGIPMPSPMPAGPSSTPGSSPLNPVAPPPPPGP